MIVISQAIENIYSRIPKADSYFSKDNRLHEKTVSTLNKPKPITVPESTSAIDIQKTPSLLHTVHKSYVFTIHPFSKTKVISKTFFLQTIIR